MKLLSIILVVMLICTAMLLFHSTSAKNQNYPCHFNSEIHLVEPYDLAYCYIKGGQIVWGVGFTPLKDMLNVLPKYGDKWYVSSRSAEQLSACDDSNHCYILKTSNGLAKDYLTVEFWGTGWQDGVSTYFVGHKVIK